MEKDILVNMPYRHRRACPICGKPNLLSLSHHLSQVHGLSSEARQPWLQRASHLPTPVDMSVEQYPVSLPPSSSPVVAMSTHRPFPPVHCCDTQPHPDFVFQHPYSMMVVGPSQCGKTHFVHQLLTHKCIAYPDKKPWRVCWYYNQWQPKYAEIQGDLKNKIQFSQGLPEVEEDLSSIPTSKHTIIVLDDLMEEAKESPLVSKLFTQGRHRNASVILLLQNMFPKGKYNTDISRNATYKVLFRSPGDRKKIDIMAEQTFAKDRPRFMQAYSQETDRPYGYLVVDNHPRTASERQVVGDVFGDCFTYPHITSTSPLSLQTKIDPVPLPEKPVTRKRKVIPTKKRKFQNKSNKHKGVPIKKRKLQTKKPSLNHWKTWAEVEKEDEELTSEEDSTSEEGEEESAGEEGDDMNEETPSDREENQYGGWQYPKHPLHAGIGFRSRLVYS